MPAPKKSITMSGVLLPFAVKLQFTGYEDVFFSHILSLGKERGRGFNICGVLCCSVSNEVQRGV